eukprot:TRINITY_DN370_c0_g1_i3.p2 TRINITY_DN370_c0_g1~~TRINITY_DN370_c0_g1_i3.p2  ORF type:complete len:238 (+),score=68.91 TRINITY_DN370_c0_g1_i3:54-767(+)
MMMNSQKRKLENVDMNLEPPKKKQKIVDNNDEMDIDEERNKSKILLIGDLKLRQKCNPICFSNNDVKYLSNQTQEDIKELECCLEDFRQKNGFGRAIAAVQIGIMKRFIAIHVNDNKFFKEQNQTFSMLNPVITNKSEETFTLWDDCMSFPWILVKVRRSKSISIEYTSSIDLQRKIINNLPMDLSELIQHEVDHLNGVLATDLAIDDESIISRESFMKNREYYVNQVDYFIDNNDI